MVPRGRAAAALPALLTGAVVAGCGGGGSSTGDPVLPQTAADRVAVDLVTVTGLGPVLADGDGHVLYMFPPDAGGRVACTGACAGVWPPLAVTADARTTAGQGVNEKLLGTLPDPNTGGQVITYAGYPLYRYTGDVDSGTANGQALFNNGGPWYVLDADGEPITIDPEAAP